MRSNWWKNLVDGLGARGVSLCRAGTVLYTLQFNVYSLAELKRQLKSIDQSAALQTTLDVFQ
eukprot:m.70176 g.70176  ORF g.70176 m.70176 type:complete len:62 (+) comp35663_c0_seq3:244-429(+)